MVVLKRVHTDKKPSWGSGSCVPLRPRLCLCSFSPRLCAESLSKRTSGCVHICLCLVPSVFYGTCGCVHMLYLCLPLSPIVSICFPLPVRKRIVYLETRYRIWFSPYVLPCLCANVWSTLSLPLCPYVFPCLRSNV